MPPRPGRNDRCPCGSGRKYKHCCLIAETLARAAPANLEWNRLRRLLDALRRDELAFALRRFGDVAIVEAWEAFTGREAEDDPFTPGNPHMALFMPWFFHHWSPDPEGTAVTDVRLHDVPPTRAWMDAPGSRVDPFLREYLEACLTAPYTFFVVETAVPGRSLQLADLLTGERHDVLEASASRTLASGDMLCGQVARARSVTMLEASSSFAFLPDDRVEVIDFRDRHAKGGYLSPTDLRVLEPAVLGLYHALAERRLHPRLPELRNTDGEALSLRKLVFDVPSAQEAFDALKHLACADSDDELLQDATRDASGALRRVGLTWLKPGNATTTAMSNTVLGTLEIDGTRLTAEVNSDAREQRLREELARALGARATYRATEIRSGESTMRAGSPSAPDGASNAALMAMPEVQAKIADMLARHYATWPDEKLPALGGKTPRQAVRTAAGREKVAALIDGIESNGRRQTPPLDAAITRRLREQLGLDTRR